MDRLYVGDLGGANDPWDVEITFGRQGGTDADRFVGQSQIGCIPIRLTKHRHHLNTQVAAGADDP